MKKSGRTLPDRLRLLIIQILHQMKYMLHSLRRELSAFLDKLLQGFGIVVAFIKEFKRGDAEIFADVDALTGATSCFRYC